MSVVAPTKVVAYAKFDNTGGPDNGALIDDSAHSDNLRDVVFGDLSKKIPGIAWSAQTKQDPGWEYKLRKSLRSMGQCLSPPVKTFDLLTPKPVSMPGRSRPGAWTLVFPTITRFLTQALACQATFGTAILPDGQLPREGLRGSYTITQRGSTADQHRRRIRARIFGFPLPNSVGTSLFLRSGRAGTTTIRKYSIALTWATPTPNANGIYTFKPTTQFAQWNGVVKTKSIPVLQH